jgi:hypothetical protein
LLRCIERAHERLLHGAIAVDHLAAEMTRTGHRKCHHNQGEPPPRYL